MKVIGIFIVFTTFYSIVLKGQVVKIQFESSQSVVVEDKKTNTVKHYIPILIEGEITSDLTINAEIMVYGSFDKNKAKLTKSKFNINLSTDKKENEKDKKEIIELEIQVDSKKITGEETIVMELNTDNKEAKIEKKYHTVIIKYEGKYNYLTTSIGTNFDYLNDGVQAKKLYWDLDYFNPAINDSRIFLRTKLYQNRNFSVDSTGTERYPYEYAFLDDRLGESMSGSTPIDTLLFQRNILKIESDQLTTDNYGFLFDCGLRLNPIENQMNFFLGIYSEIILRKFTRNVNGTNLSTDTISILQPRGEPLSLRGIQTGETTSTSLDSYLGLSIMMNHVSDNFEFQLSPAFTWGKFLALNGSSQSRQTAVGIIRLMVRERNSGIKLGFEYRSGGTIDQIYLLNLSKTFSLSKSDLFTKL